nr:MAG TPA: Polypeptide deformylase [Caudoviricetes sp.]
MNINICQLFKVRNNVESGVSLVETPLAYDRCFSHEYQHLPAF